VVNASLAHAYRQGRRNLISDGNPPREKDDGADAGQPAARGVNLRPALELEDRTVMPGNQLTPAEEESLLQLQPDAPAIAGTAETPKVRVWLPNPQ